LDLTSVSPHSVFVSLHWLNSVFARSFCGHRRHRRRHFHRDIHRHLVPRIRRSSSLPLLPSAALPVSRPLLSHTLTPVLTSVRHISSRVVLVSTCSVADASGQMCFLPRLRVNPLSYLDCFACPAPAVLWVLGCSPQGQFDVSNRMPLSVFQLLSMLLT
jgi:hypothetical protein